MRRDPPAAERPSLPHRVLHRAVPRQRHRRVDGVRAAGVLRGRANGHGEPEGVVGQAGDGGALQVGHQDGHRAVAAGLGGDEHAAADHAAAASGVDAPGDPAAGVRRRAESHVGGAVRRVVRPVQAGAEHREGGAPLERPIRGELGGRAVLLLLLLRRGGGRREEHQHGREEEPSRLVPSCSCHRK